MSHHFSKELVNPNYLRPLGETGGAPPGSNLAMILAHSSAGKHLFFTVSYSRMNRW